MKQKPRLPTLMQLEQAKELLASRLFGNAAIAHRTGLRLADVFRIAGTMPKENEPKMPNPKKRFAELLELLCEKP